MSVKKEDEFIKRGEMNSWIEGPCRYNIGTQIRNYCIDNGLTIHKIDIVPINTSFFDRVLDGKRETIYFHISGNIDDLKVLSENLKRLSQC